MAQRYSGMKVRSVYPVDQPSPKIGAGDRSASAQVTQFGKRIGDGRSDTGDDQGGPEAPAAPRRAVADNLAFLHELATVGGDISALLDEGEVDAIGIRACREWETDKASTQDWREVAERGLDLAAQDFDEDEQGDIGPWEGASDVHLPFLTQAAMQFQARTLPEFIKGDKAVGIKVFTPPEQEPNTAQTLQNLPPPQNPQQQQVAQQAGQQAQQQAQQQESQADQAMDARRARAQRVAHYMNFQIFYKMDDWEAETDLLLLESAVTGIGFKKVYMGSTSLCSDYVSAMRLTVANSTRNLTRCPRITQDFDIYPYEVREGQAAGRYRTIDIFEASDDPEEPLEWIEQHRMEDLDGDGLAEPYIVTVDTKTKRTMRIEAAFTPDDIIIGANNKVLRIDRWQPFAAFQFMLDPKGRFYGMGLARLLEMPTESIDTMVNQLIDAGNAEIAGGGFIGAGVRLQGSGQGGSLWFRPGEYQSVATPGGNLQQAIWERTTPHPSAVAMQMIEMLTESVRDLASIQNVVTGDGPTTAPVGTTLAIQNQALLVPSSIMKRMYRGLKDEFQKQYQALKRWATPEMRREYTELTGGNFDEDFQGDGTDIQPVADPTVVTKMQKISKMQTQMQLAESALGQSAGMLQPGPAKALIQDMLDVLDVDRPERFTADVPPNPELVAKVQEMAAAASLKQAEAQHIGAKVGETQAKTSLDSAKATHEQALTVRDMGEVGEQNHRLHQEAHRVAVQGILPPPEGMEDGTAAPGT